jgi:hypothetical protein
MNEDRLRRGPRRVRAVVAGPVIPGRSCDGYSKNQRGTRFAPGRALAPVVANEVS